MAKQMVDLQIPREELAEVIQAYHKIGDFLETVVRKEDLYQKRFTEGLDRALEEVRQKQTKRVTTFEEFTA